MNALWVFMRGGGAHFGGNIIGILQISFKRWKREEVYIKAF